MKGKLNIQDGKRGFLLWFILTLVVFAFINPFDIAIWKDRAYLMYMSQMVFRGADLYENTPIGYTPLAFMVAGYAMSFIKFFVGDLDTVLVSRLMGITLHALLTSSLYCLCLEVFKKTRPAHLVCLLFLGILAFLKISATNFEPKFLAVLLEIWAIHGVLKGKTLRSGLLFSLAAMCWQPMVINCLVMVPYFVIQRGFNRFTFKRLALFSIGVLIGTIPCLLYLHVTGDLVIFWNQAVIRKANYEGGVLFEAPLAWLSMLLNPKLLLDSAFLVLGLGVVLIFGLSTFFKGSFLRLPVTQLSAPKVLLAISTGWFCFNSLEFQGALDLLPLIPVLLIFAVYPFQRYLEGLSAKYFRLLLVVITLYAFFDFALPDEGMTFAEQKELISELNESYGDAFVMNFEEYYVLQEKPMPTRYMRLARFEDNAIGMFEQEGCASLINRLNETQPQIIISKRTSGLTMSATGECGQQLLDTFSESLITTFQINHGIRHPMLGGERVFTYDIFATIFYDGQ